MAQQLLIKSLWQDRLQEPPEVRRQLQAVKTETTEMVTARLQKILRKWTQRKLRCRRRMSWSITRPTISQTILQRNRFRLILQKQRLISGERNAEVWHSTRERSLWSIWKQTMWMQQPAGSLSMMRQGMLSMTLWSLQQGRAVMLSHFWRRLIRYCRRVMCRCPCKCRKILWWPLTSFRQRMERKRLISISFMG